MTANRLKDCEAQKDTHTCDPEFSKREMAVCISSAVVKASRT